MPNFSWIIFANGAKQLVVHDAFEITDSLSLYSVWLTPTTYIGASADGAEITTFFAPPEKCAEACSVVVKTPVDSTTTSTFALSHLIIAGSLSVNNLTHFFANGVPS